METIYYSKRFTSGNLKGIVVHSKVTLPTVKDCLVFSVGKVGKDALTGARWIVVDSAFQNYRRN